MDKHELRRLIRTEKRHFSQQELAEMSLSIINKLVVHPRVRAAKAILMYYSLPDEVDTHAVINRFLDDDKTVLLPVVVGDGIMQLRYYTGETSLKKGAYNIMEPCGELYTKLNSIDVAVVPGMAFDQLGNRLGRGKGYYDRFLASMPTVYRIGICFDFQKVSRVPTDANDIRMNEVL